MLSVVRKRSFPSLSPGRQEVDDIIRAEGAIIRRSFASRIVVKMAVPIGADGCEDGLRFRRCCDPSCNAVFAICRSCDHGQRYCSAAYRKRRRSQQLTAAGRRYQATDAGRLAHRCRQREYRERHSQANVTHQGSPSMKPPDPPSQHGLSQCAICGRKSLWNDPFDRVPRPYGAPQRTRRRRHAQIYTFLHDR